MGLFDFLFGGKSRSTVEVVSDRIWMTQQAKFNSIRNELKDRSEAGSTAILLIAHFADTLEPLNLMVAECQVDAPSMATLADRLSLEIAARFHLSEAATLDLIVAERHPLWAVDDKVRQFAEGLPCRCRLTYHLSLEDPLLKRFAGKWVANTLEALGMSEYEALESNMVSRRVQQAQKKIQTQAIGNTTAGSAAEWLEKNMPKTSNE